MRYLSKCGRTVYNPSTWELEAGGNQNFKVILDYMSHSKPAWDPVSKRKQQQEQIVYLVKDTIEEHLLKCPESCWIPCIIWFE